MKKLVITVVVGLLAWCSGAAPGRAQSATTERPQFEVASIRPSDANATGPEGMTIVVDGIRANKLSLLRLIAIAYSLREEQIEGGPQWIRTDRYDIAAKGRIFSERQADLMLQALLTDRFQLRTHKETKIGTVYELAIAKEGVKMQPTEEGSCIDPSKPHAANTPDQPLVFCNIWQQASSGARGRLIGSGISISDAPGPPQQSLAGQLTEVLGRPVQDKTGLKGTFQVHLIWTPDATVGHGADEASMPSGDAGPSIFTAIREQLGLELKRVRAPDTVLVVDGVERPSEN